MLKALKRFLVVMVAIVIAPLQMTFAEEPNYVVAPTTLTVGIKGQQSISTNFMSLTNDGPYQLTIINGSGREYTKQVCSGNFLKKLICLAGNILIDFKIASERVSVAEVVLNGKKIVTGRQINKSVTSLSLPVQLKANNQLSIKIIGLASSHLTYKIVGKSNALSGSLAISNPSDQSILQTHSTSVVGKAISSAPNLRLLLNGQIEIPFSGNGSDFNYLYEHLNHGLNIVKISLFSGTTLLDHKELRVVVSLPGTGGGLVSNQGGTISVGDSNSSLYGTSLQVPAGALNNSEYLTVQHGDDWGPNIPYKYTNLGPIVSVGPMYQEFSSDVTFTIPYDLAKIPNGGLQEKIKVLAFDGQSWVVLDPSAITSNSASLKTKIFDHYAYQAVLETPLQSGDLQVLSNVAGATIYIDGLYKGDLTPSTITGITDGVHTIKIFAPGYNEVQRTVHYPGEKRIDVELTRQDIAGPKVDFSPEIIDGMVVQDNLMQITGQVAIDLTQSNQGFVVLSQNAQDISQPLSADGRFSFIVPLFRGENYVQIRATVNGRTGLSPEIKIIQNPQQNSQLRFALPTVFGVEGDLASRLEQDPYSVAIRKQKLVESVGEKARSSLVANSAEEERLDQEIKVVLTWDKNDTDVDTHIYDEYGGHAWYGALGGIEQGTLDRDDVDGFGPEIFTLARPRPGKYRVRIHYFSDHQNGSTTATLRIYLAGQLVFQRARSLSTGASWEAYTIDVQGITITNISTIGGKSREPQPKECQQFSKFTCTNQIFTTLANESNINVQVSAPESILDSQIRYRVREVSENFNVPVTVTGREVNFRALAKALVALNSPRVSRRLIYEVIAFTDAGLESAPYYMVQDTKSQIRQEYIDKRNFYPAFARATPAYGDISNGNGYPTQAIYSFREMVSFSDFSNYGLGMIGKSLGYANSVNSAYFAQNPSSPKLILSSGWRNPRRNDKLDGSSKNSFHQTGDSLDLVTSEPQPGTESKTILHDRNLMALCEIAFNALTDADVIYHLGHVHIEPASGVRKKDCSSKP